MEAEEFCYVCNSPPPPSSAITASVNMLLKYTGKENSRCVHRTAQHSTQLLLLLRHAAAAASRATTCHLCTSQTKNNYHSLSHSSLGSICPFRRPKGRQKIGQKAPQQKILFFSALLTLYRNIPQAPPKIVCGSSAQQ